MSDLEKYYLCLDTGTTQTGYAIICEDYSIVAVGKIENNAILAIIHQQLSRRSDEVVFEKFAPQQSMGKTTLDAIVWYGKFVRQCEIDGLPYHEIYRRDVKKHLLGKFSKANGSADSQIRRALITRFAKYDLKNGKGTKDNPDWFYGFSGSDMYAAYAVGVTYLDLLRGGDK